MRMGAGEDAVTVLFGEFFPSGFSSYQTMNTCLDGIVAFLVGENLLLSFLYLYIIIFINRQNIFRLSYVRNCDPDVCVSTPPPPPPPHDFVDVCWPRYDS